jgi:hypothetical protein
MKFLILSLLFASTTAFAAAEVGKPAPDFSLVGHDGKTYKLSDFKHHNVILEWYNKDCPFVRKHYNTQNMQSLQTKVKGGVYRTPNVWLTIVSSAEGKQGYLTAKQAAEQYAKEGMASRAILLDTKGEVGKAYSATTTPHMFIINGQGQIVYAGAIDSISSSSGADVAKAENYIIKALGEMDLKKPVSTATTKPYGCGVKYN